MLLKPCKILLPSRVEQAILLSVSEQNTNLFIWVSKQILWLSWYTFMTNLFYCVNLYVVSVGKHHHSFPQYCLREIVFLFNEHTALPSPTKLLKPFYSKAKQEPINKCIFYIPILQCILTSECAMHFYSPDCLHFCIITVFSIPSAAKQNQTNSCSDFKAGKILIVASACLQ